MKQNQQGGITAGLIALLISSAILVSIAAIAFTSYIKWGNYGVQAEVSLNKVWKNNQNILGQYTTKVQEVAQVPGMYSDDLKGIIAAEMSGRYGQDGSKASMQWIKERSLNFDSSMYTKIQQVMEAGRNEFQAAQTRLIDEKATYEANLGFFWSGFWLRMNNYPKVDMAKYKPVVAADTEMQFEKGVGGPVQLRPAK